MSGATPHNDKDGRHSIATIKDKKASGHHRSQDAIRLTPHDAALQKPSARNTPMISIQPHYAEISTDRPSVSGRIYLHIPKIPGKKFRFVSLTLLLRLKESMAWTRQDLSTFEIDKQSWSQTVWERKIDLPYQDRQVEEGSEPYVAVVKESSSKNHHNTIEIAADEWRWEWLMPVTDREVRPESFEGSMGNVWYELEAKCLFRWDDIDKDGNVLPSTGENRIYDTTPDSLIDRTPAATLLKAVEASTAKSRSLAQVFGKLRVGGKSKKIQTTGDFSPADQHDKFIKESLRARKNSMPQGSTGVSSQHVGLDAQREDLLLASPRAQSTSQINVLGSSGSSLAPPVEHPPFLIRKVFKLYFVKPPPSISANPAFFLPPPSMALPNLPGTRRLKAIIPGARIQVQIQIPSLIPIRGYAQTSQLVPDKKGGLVLSKHAQQHHHYYHHSHQNSNHALETDSAYLDSFQVALTVRKVTQKEINNNDHLKKRYNSATTGFNPPAIFASMGENTSGTGTIRRRLQSSSNFSSADMNGQYVAGARFDDNSVPIGAVSQTERLWRKEIFVRKVKCEFWQKESCRFPSSTNSDSPSRSVIYAIGPAFAYSEKEQARDRQRERSHSFSQQTTSQMSPIPRSSAQQTSAVPWDTNVTSGLNGVNEDPRKAIRQNSNLEMPTSPILKTANLSFQSNLSAPSSPLQAPVLTQFERKGSNASQYSSMTSSQPRASCSSSNIPRPPMNHSHPSSQGSKPFMLLIPVPLDSPKLRQTFAWPSADTPAPTNNKAYEPLPMPTMGMPNTEAGLVGLDSLAGDSPRTSESGLAGDDVLGMGVGSPRHYHGQNRLHQHQMAAVKAQATRSRIEVKHYLSLRLSIDMHEYEGELDPDEDLDLEAIEEQQLQLVRDRQEIPMCHLNAIQHAAVVSRPGAALPTVSAPGLSSSTSSLNASSTSLSAHPSLAAITQVYDNAAVKNPATVSASSLISTNLNHTGSVAPSTSFAASNGGMTTLHPALTFLNSAASLLDTESNEAKQHPDNRSHRDHGNNTVQIQSNASSTISLNGPIEASQDHAYFTVQPPYTTAYISQQRRESNASQGTVKSNSTTDSNQPHHHHHHPTSLVAGAIDALKKKVSTTALNSIVNVVTPPTQTSVSSLSQTHLANSSNVHMTSQQQHSHPLLHSRTYRSVATVHKLKDFVIRVPITVVIQVEDLTRIGTAQVDGADSVTQTTGASAAVTETQDGSQGSEFGTDLKANLRSDEIVQSNGSGSHDRHGSLYAHANGHEANEDSQQYLSVMPSQRLVEGKEGKGRKMSIGNSMEIRSIHGQIEGENEYEDAEYVEGQFIADQE
ncbi:hypothetical protein FBU30_003502 [Linnemannia zychae]|nr:hypothetical protein FBU30_003502 [Linnemannia zychae]